MRYLSTRGSAPILGFDEVLLAGLARDGGLYVPESWPQLSAAQISALAGKSYVGRILVLDTSKGGVASAWMLHEMRARDKAPLALVFNSVNPILAQGTALAGIPMLAGFEVDVTAAVPDGARVEIDPAARTLRIL